ncbi:unnamed protein product [Sphagnum compactum]
MGQAVAEAAIAAGLQLVPKFFCLLPCMQVTESHQSSEVDTSGTAKAVISSFQKLGLPFNLDQIEMVRDPEEQVTRMGVPSEPPQWACIPHLPSCFC